MRLRPSSYSGDKKDKEIIKSGLKEEEKSLSSKLLKDFERHLLKQKRFPGIQSHQDDPEFIRFGERRTCKNASEENKEGENQQRHLQAKEEKKNNGLMGNIANLVHSVLGTSKQATGAKKEKENTQIEQASRRMSRVSIRNEIPTRGYSLRSKYIKNQPSPEKQPPKKQPNKENQKPRGRSQKETNINKRVAFNESLPQKNKEKHIQTPLVLEPRVEDCVFSLSCETVLTSSGSELARVTVVNYYGETVYDSYVTPESEIKSYSKDFKLVPTESFPKEAKSLKRVQDDLRQLLFSDSIIVGHCIENDLNALRVIHSKVIDTASLFRGASWSKPTLEELAEQRLRVKINEKKQSSRESATVAMALAKLKINELDSLPLDQSPNLKEDLPNLSGLLDQGAVVSVFAKEERIKRYQNLEGIEVFGVNKKGENLSETLEQIEKSAQVIGKSIGIAQLNLKGCGREEFLKIDRTLQRIFESNKSSTLFSRILIL